MNNNTTTTEHRIEAMPSEVDFLNKRILELKLEVGSLKSRVKRKKHSATKKGVLKIGDKVEILDPKQGQSHKGIVTKIGTKSGYVIVQTEKGKVV